MPGEPRRALAPLMLIVSLFFLWGVANNLNDVLVAHFRQAFALSDLQSGLVQSAFYLGYFAFALPAAAFARHFGYKAAVVVGLLLYGAGALLFYPAAEARVYGFFLGALFVIASGLAFLETCANPLMTVLGPEHSAERRLNFAQAFNPLGAIAGVVVGRLFILSGFDPGQAALKAMGPGALDRLHAQQAHAVQGPYLLLGALVIAWAALTAMVRFPAEASRPAPGERASAAWSELPTLIARPAFLFGVLAQFSYVGAQVGVWSFLIRYARAAMPGVTDRAGADYLLAALCAFMAGRFVGAALMSRVKASRLLAAFALMSTALCLAAATTGGSGGLMALVATSFFMSIMYPTIFAVTIKGLGSATKLGASILVMAIVGGAVLPAVMGRISDAASIEVAMLAPAAAFAVVFAFALLGRSRATPALVEGLAV